MATTEEFEAALRLVLKDEVSNALKGTVRTSDIAAKQTARGWKGAFATIESSAQKAQKTIQRGQSQIKSGAITMAAGAAMAAPLVLAAKASATFQDGMAEVATLTTKSAAEITESFGPIVNATRKTFGADSQNTIKALYDGFSAGVPKTQAAAREYLKATGEMALGGKTDMAAAADAITTVKNAWEFEGLSFKQIVDQTFVGVQEGKTTVTELAASMGQAGATVAGARVKYSEFIGAVAALTSAGVKTPQAMTQISASIMALQKPSEEAQKAFKKVRAEITPLTLEQRGYAGTLEYLTDRINKSTKNEAKRKQLLNEMFGSLEAIKAVALLAGDSNDKFKGSTDRAATGVGAMAEAARKMTEGPMHDYRQSVQNVQIAWETFGSVTAPIFSDILSATSLIIQDTTKWVSENKDLVATLSKAVLAVAALTVAFGAAKIILGVVTMIKGVTIALWGMNTALLANPVVLVAAAVVAATAAIGGALYMIITRTDEVGLFLEFLGLKIALFFNGIVLDIGKSILWVTDKINSITGWNLGEDVREGLEKPLKGRQVMEGKMEHVLRQQRAINERREELGSKKSEKATPQVNLGGVTNNLMLPEGVNLSDVKQSDLGDLSKKMAEIARKAIQDTAKQNNRERI